ncbi:MAG: glycosyltransferase [Azoarcus sp.]|jgi:GT2 family glycosyltransferase/glycosyltransferase involved in cell wall biosynthesis|nr:glycosyltransferase [Azoarcus sp.]
MTFWQEEETDVPVVDIIVPMHTRREVAQRCLAALYAASCHAAREIIVIDDASPDPLLAEWLDSEAAASRITLLRNEERRGFAASVNSGMALHPGRDVVLLDSGAEVANDWLDRLLACARSQPDIGAVTPFSDNGAICAYPFDGWAGGMPGTLGLAALDALAARINAGQWVDLPTMTRRCALIRRKCLDMIGFFDAERFARGHGEDKDFSRRAVAVGWRNVLAADVFVHQAGSAVPGPAELDAADDAAHTLTALYPDYDAKMQDFIRRDPAAWLRARLDRARASLGGSEFAAVMDEQARMRAAHANLVNPPARPPLPTVLHVAHGRDGTERWVRDYCAADLGCHNLVLRGRSSRNATTTELLLIDPRLGPAPLMSWTLAEPVRGTAVEHPEYDRIVHWICAAFEVRALLISSLAGHSLDLLRLDIPVVLITHDLYPFCPALSATFGNPCTRCGDDDLARCLRENPHNAFWHLTNVREWQILRAVFAARVAADNVRIVAPDEDVHARWAALFPSLGARPWTCIPHGLGAPFARGPVLPSPDFSHGAAQAAHPDAPPRLRVLVPGRLLPQQGLWLWRQIYDGLRAFADILLLGCGEFGRPFANYSGIEVVPEHDADELPARVAQWRPDCALLLSVLPESFGYALAEMQALAVPVVATRVGSYVERIDSGWNGFLVEPEAGAVLDKLRALDRARDRLSTVVDILRFSPVRTAFDMVADYRRLLPELGAVEAVDAAENLLSTLARRLRGQEEIARLRDLLQVRDEEARSRALNQRRLEAMVGALAAQHAAILHSPSWKVSAPVRTLERLWDSLCRRFSPPPDKPEVVRTRAERRRVPRPEVPVPILLRSRAAARYWLCEAISVPDGAVIIAGGGSGEQPAAALHNFVALADIVTRHSTRACFVWCGRLDNLRTDDALALRLLREVRDLFVLDAHLEAEVFAGADVLLLPAEAAGRDCNTGTVAGIPHVDLPLGAPENGTGGVMAATVTQLLQYSDGTDQTDAPQY